VTFQRRILHNKILKATVYITSELDIWGAHSKVQGGVPKTNTTRIECTHPGCTGFLGKKKTPYRA
jgi:hypothetical protein